MFPIRIVFCFVLNRLCYSNHAYFCIGYWVRIVLHHRHVFSSANLIRRISWVTQYYLVPASGLHACCEVTIVSSATFEIFYICILAWLNLKLKLVLFMAKLLFLQTSKWNLLNFCKKVTWPWPSHTNNCASTTSSVNDCRGRDSTSLHN